MEFSIDAVANKMILVIVCLSVFVVAAGAIFFQLNTSFYLSDAVPFAVGVFMAMAVNVIKVIWLKKTINKTVDMDAPQYAKVFFSLQYFLRIVFTGAVLLIAALAPDNIVNLLGVIIGILTFPIAMRFMQFFIPADTATSYKTLPDADIVQDSTDEINATGKDDE